MCIGEPARLVSRSGIAGVAMIDGRETLIDLSLTPDAKAGDWLLCFLGTAREILEPEEAAVIAAALEGLRRVMAGQDPGAAFADLDAREPELPPHLQAALAAGHSQG
ncbi:HypC/HybG/HupF family hydrogenase formation chaperone [Pannonibacter sp. Q-1]|uniref:Hydrogenase n=1 Tax=Pannonibacter phragmitetus TaxID=121719 RepID=A0A0L0IV61_9HYPH|nr:HypC/HybG/HupF family hydrogenase formation chaperone [Pannonibacter phragmitetus]ALV27890.1 hydrogenase [Pannonibacter phragmitetus]KND17163.1 hydrogenase [Pannonibacter phragmitetus]MBA4203700.1 HypC/HybG/HupF family hydrogenase formation chaperone [Polymorphum sp.]